MTEGTETSEMNEPTGRVEASGQRGFRKTREGLVVADKMDKTVVVAVEDRVQHPLYGKTIRRTNKLKAHDERNSATLNSTTRNAGRDDAELPLAHDRVDAGDVPANGVQPPVVVQLPGGHLKPKVEQLFLAIAQPGDQVLHGKLA